MGTNYYLHVLKDDACAHCGKPASIEIMHIGKSSSGWCFSLHAIPEKHLFDLIDWVLLMTFAPPGTEIKDEYGNSIAFKDLMVVITKRSGCLSGWTQRKLDANFAEPGPNNLVRFKIDGQHCARHGAGTWDLIVGEFR